MITAASHSSKAAAERYFRLYHRHCVEPDEDTLFALLNSVHSLNDRLSKELKVDFYSCKEFVPLQALRNLFHHKTELTHEVRLIPVANLPAISTDLIFLCLVGRGLVEQSIVQISTKRRQADRETIEDTLKWYGPVANINPCIFNFSVRVYERFNELSIELDSDEYDKFSASYEYETQHGHSHFVSGDISCLASDVNTVLAKAFGDVA